MSRPGHLRGSLLYHPRTAKILSRCSTILSGQPHEPMYYLMKTRRSSHLPFSTHHQSLEPIPCATLEMHLSYFTASISFYPSSSPFTPLSHLRLPPPPAASSTATPTKKPASTSSSARTRHPTTPSIVSSPSACVADRRVSHRCNGRGSRGCHFEDE